MYSDNLWDVAKRNNFWDESKGLLDFLPTYAPKRAHSTYATRRVWRIFSIAAPSLVLPDSTDAYGNDYPFSVPVDRKLEASDIMGMLRDHYEGTRFDLTKGLAAGPYGTPDRFDAATVDGMDLQTVLNGSFERAVSLFRTSISVIGQSRGSLPNSVGALVWVGQYAPSSSNYLPVYVSGHSLPRAYTR